MIARDRTIDVARGVGIVLVVFGHALEMSFNAYLRGDHPFDPRAFEVWRFIYSFHMPLFFFISGAVAGDIAKVPARKMLRSVFRLLILASLLHVLFFPFRLELPSLTILEAHRTPLEIMRAFLEFTVLRDYSLVVIWFLPALAVVRLLVWVMYVRGPFVAILVTFGTFFAYEFLELHFTQFFQSESAIFGILFFVLGMESFRARWTLDAFYRWAPIVSPVALIGVYLTYDLNHGCLLDLQDRCDAGPHGFAVQMVAGLVGFLPLFLATASLGILFVFGLARGLASVPIGRAVEWIGRNTLAVLIVNGIFVVFVQPLVAPSVAVGGWVGISLLFLAIQLALTPVFLLVLNPLDRFCDRLAGWLTDRLARASGSVRLRFGTGVPPDARTAD